LNAESFGQKMHKKKQGDDVSDRRQMRRHLSAGDFQGRRAGACDGLQPIALGILSQSVK